MTKVRESLNKSDLNFVLIGPIASLKEKNIRKRLNKIKNYNNVHWVGEKDYNDIPEYLGQFNICIIPFKVNNLIKKVDPIKVYEYLALGKPVVSTNWEEMQSFGSLVIVSNSSKEFLRNIEEELRNDNPEKRRRRREFAENNSWQNRAQKIIDILLKGY